MKFKFTAIFLSLFFSLSSHASNSTCENFLNSDLISLYKTYFKIQGTKPSVWKGFNLSDNLIFLTHDKNPRCLISFLKGKPVSVHSLQKDIEVEDWMAVDITVPTYPPLENDFINLIKSFNKQEALVINSTKHLFQRIEIAAHEAFHTFHQTDSKTPRWWNHIDREEISKKCYHDYGDKYKAEAEILITAYDFLLQGHTQIAKQFLQYFVQARQQRYKDLRDVVINNNGKPYTCEEAEVHMEFLEGQAQFVGERVAIELGLLSRYSIASEYKYSLYSLDIGWIEPFYYFGSLQLHIIRFLKKDHFLQYTEALYKTTTYSEASLFSRLTSLL